MEDQLLNRRLSRPRAALVVAVAAALAAVVAVSPSFAGSFLTNQKAAHVYLTNKKAAGLYLKKKAAGNLFVKKIDAPAQPVVGIAAGTAAFTAAAKTAGYIPSAFTAFATKADISRAVITFSGASTCTAATAGLACPIQILVDGQVTGKVNFALSTTGTPAAQPEVNTVMQTAVLPKGGHTIALQYAGADKVTFKLLNWNLAVEAYPEQPEAPEEAAPGEKGATSK